MTSNRMLRNGRRRVPRIEGLERRALLAADVVINEFMASNATVLYDGFGQDPDWIELHNPSGELAQIGGHHLSDDAAMPTQWQFPADTTIEPFGYLVVFASGKDTLDIDGNLHTNFSLDRDGENVVFSNPSGAILSQASMGDDNYPRQFTDISYGFEGFGRFDSTHDPIRIRGDQVNSISSDIVVEGLTGAITDVDVTINIEHDWASDLNVNLRSPEGARVELFSGVGRSGDDFRSTTLDDEAATSIVRGAAPFTGAFQPEGSLADFDGQTANGSWTLEIDDTFAAVGGELLDWTLNLETTDTPAEPRQGYQLRPTPGGPNFDIKLGYVQDTSFSVDRGFFSEPFNVEVTTLTEDATIYTTIDGSEPSPDNPAASVYTQPIRIETTTTLRAAAFKDGALPTNVDTQTYLFLPDVVNQSANQPGLPTRWVGRQTIPADYGMDPEIINNPRFGERMIEALEALPTMSVVMGPDDWFDEEIGIYANSQESGFAWERAASVELFGFDHGEEIQVNAGVRMQGNASRAPSRPKHNMRLAFRSQYGPSTLDFPLFEDTPIESFNSIVLRGGNGDSWINPTVHHRGAYIRDQWHRDIQRAMGHETSLQGYVHLYLNGLYWGLFHAFERVEADFMAERFGGTPDDYDVIKDIRNTGGRLEAISGSTATWLDLVRRTERDMTLQENYESVQELLDLENFVDYLILNFYSGNQDWDRSNWRAGRKREEGSKFMLFSWDAERTDLNTSNSTNDASVNVNFTGTNNRNYPTYLHQNLTANAEYRLFFADRLNKHLYNDGVLTPENAAAAWNARADEIRLPIYAESARWGDTHIEPPRTPDTWEGHLDSMNQTWFPRRRDIVISQLERRDLYPDVAAPQFSQLSQTITEPIELAITAAEPGTTYYTLDGSDPRMNGGEVRPGAIVVDGPIQVAPGTLVRSRTIMEGEWSALTEAFYESGRPFGDVDNSGTTDVQDLDAICRSVWADPLSTAFDLNEDQTVNMADVRLLLDTVFNSGAGDANADGQFDSSDLVRVFSIGHFEDGVRRNSLWSTGDWNCDGEFSTTDLVEAFQTGAFVNAAAPTAALLADIAAALDGEPKEE